MVRKLLMILLLCILLIVTGCWNRRELNELAIATGMGIDKQGEQYKVSVQVVVPSEIAAKKGLGRTPVVLYSAVGDSVFEAIRKMTTESPRKIYIAHLRILILGEKLASEGIGKSLEFLTRDSEARSDFFIAVSKESKAEDVLKVLTTLDSIPANMLFSSLETSQKVWAPTMSVTMDELIAALTSESRNPVLTGILVHGDPNEGGSSDSVKNVKSPVRLQYTTLAVFRKDKLIGWLNEMESKAYNYIMDKVHSTAAVIKCPSGGNITLEVIRTKTKVKGKVIHKKPQIEINIRGEVNVNEVGCEIDLTKPRTIRQVERIAENRVKELVNEVIHTAKQKYKVDIFGFGQVIRRSNPKAWKVLRRDWDRYFMDLEVIVNVDASIRQLGTVGNSFLGRIKE